MNNKLLSIGNRYSLKDLENLTGKGFPNVNLRICRRVNDKGNPYGLLFSTDTSDYNNEISDKGKFWYIGEGKNRQSFKEDYPQCGNCFIRDSILGNYPLHFFHRENKNNKYEYRGKLRCKGYERRDSEKEKIYFKMVYNNYPEGLPSPDKKELRDFKQKVSDKTREHITKKELKDKLVDNFLYEVLEWKNNTFNKSEIIEKYSVKVGNKSIQVDYAFAEGDNVKCLVEVKRPNTTLSENDKKQLASCMEVKECSLGLLTNGNRWIIIADNEDSKYFEQKTLIDTLLHNIDDMGLFVLLHNSTLSQKESEKICPKCGSENNVYKRKTRYPPWCCSNCSIEFRLNNESSEISDIKNAPEMTKPTDINIPLNIQRKLRNKWYSEYEESTDIDIFFSSCHVREFGGLKNIKDKFKDIYEEILIYLDDNCDTKDKIIAIKMILEYKNGDISETISPSIISDVTGCHSSYVNNFCRVKHGVIKYTWPSKSKRREVKDRDNNSCVNCSSVNNLTIHHIIPRKQGGSNNTTNLLTLCDSCHQNYHSNKDNYRDGIDTVTKFNNWSNIENISIDPSMIFYEEEFLRYIEEDNIHEVF